MPGRRQAFYGGSEKGDAEGADFVFATFDTIRREEHLARFRKDEFDMVVIDEVHRVGENHYQDIIGHFEPSFLLGMSATPDRSDGYDLYGLFDNDIILEIRLPDALEEKMLVPFSYFGIGKITIDGQDRDFEDFSALGPHEMARQIVEKSRYFGYSGDRLRALVFVSGRGSERKGTRKVEEVALALRNLGIRAEGITAATPLRERNARIERLDGPEGAEALDMLVALDVLNEGVDIPNVNQIIMARPTDSPIVFLQQLGRGLRLARGKEYVVVLDFIGNYEKGNYLIPASFTRKMEGHCSLLTMMENPFLPGVSTIQFDKVARERVMRSIAKSKLLGNRRLEEAWEDLSRRIQGKGKDAPRVPSLKDFELLSPYSARFFLDRTGGFRHDNYQEFLHRIRPEDFVEEDFGLPTVNDILKELVKPGLDPRESASEFSFSENIRTIEDLVPGMELPGIVTNITAFGAFVDIGIKQNGLIHVSRMGGGRKRVHDPSEVLKLHQHVIVEVLSVDTERNRIGLGLCSRS